MKPKFDIVLLQGHSAAAVSEKRLPYSEKYAVAHAQTIREAGSTPLLVMTWTKQEISKLADNTIRIANKAKMRAVPVGLAFEKARREKPELVMYMPDKSQPPEAIFTVQRSTQCYFTAHLPALITSESAKSLFNRKQPLSFVKSPGRSIGLLRMEVERFLRPRPPHSRRSSLT